MTQDDRAISGFGTLLKIGDGATPSENFTTVARVTEIGGPSLEKETIDGTSHDSPNRWREHLSSLRDGGEVTLSLNFLPGNATQHSVVDAYLSDDPTNFKIVFPDAESTEWGFAAHVTSFEPSAPIDDRLTASVTLKVTGAVSGIGSDGEPSAPLAFTAVNGFDGTGSMTIQLQDSAGDPLADRRTMRVWIAAADFGAPQAQTDFSVSVGTQLQEITANAYYEVLTDAAGKITMAIDLGGGGTKYVMAEIDGDVYSGSVAITAP